MVEVKNLSFSYGNKQVLEDIAFLVQKGEIVGLIGENGSGKTTLLKILAGILPGWSGDIKHNASRVGAIIETPALYEHLNVKDNLMFFSHLYGRDNTYVENVSQILDITKYEQKKVKRLSLGMKQRLGVAIALLGSDDIILLDEPTNGLDPTGIRDLLNTISELAETKKTTFIISSHIFENLEWVCNRFFVIKDKKLKEIYKDNDLFAFSIYSPQKSYLEMIQLLDKLNVKYKSDGEHIFITDCNPVVEYSKIHNVELFVKKRALKEVYFEQ